MPKGRKLTDKQARFVDEYLIDMNATQAAIRAKYSQKTASRIGPELLGKTCVAEAITKRQTKIANKLEITQEMVTAELAKLAFSNMKSFTEWGPDGVRLRPSSELTDDDARCVAEVTETTSKDGGSVKFKLHDKKGALDSLARKLGMFVDKVEQHNTGSSSLTIFVPDNGRDKKAKT